MGKSSLSDEGFNMKKSACKFLLAFVVLTGIGSAAWADYGAIAYSPQTGKWGYSYGYYYLSDAQNNALSRVDSSDARVAVWVENGWAALAKDSKGNYGWGWSTNSLADAEAFALSHVGADGSIVCWVYSGT